MSQERWKDSGTADIGDAYSGTADISTARGWGLRMGEPKMRIGDLFYSQGKKWEVVHRPFLEDSVEGEQWWYPSRVWLIANVKESLVDFEEDNDE